MNADMYKSLQRSWAVTRKRRAVDRKGLAAALIFLVVMFVGVRACSDKTTEQVSNALLERAHTLADPQRLRTAAQHRYDGFDLTFVVDAARVIDASRHSALSP